MEVELARYPSIAELRALMEQAGFDEIIKYTVEWAYTLANAQAYHNKVFSTLHLISDEAFQRGIARLERDLCAGPIPCVSRHTMLWEVKTE